MTNEEMTNEKEDIIKKKILASFNSDLKLHIKLKNGDWRNGFVKKIEADFFIFNDAVNGEEPIFFLEILKIDPYMEEVSK